ncbi:hypothetical protein [Erythrobacter longus]|uniref:hypothetical protein n=1 Tax=Erythrobacter longus TaxID=1044 RepID=UPI0012680860|nr:hypothetical protein [Erythrobacter longus]
MQGFKEDFWLGHATLNSGIAFLHKALFAEIDLTHKRYRLKSKMIKIGEANDAIQSPSKTEWERQLHRGENRGKD